MAWNHLGFILWVSTAFRIQTNGHFSYFLNCPCIFQCFTFTRLESSILLNNIVNIEIEIARQLHFDTPLNIFDTLLILVSFFSYLLNCHYYLILILKKHFFIWYVETHWKYFFKFHVPSWKQTAMITAITAINKLSVRAIFYAR